MNTLEKLNYLIGNCNAGINITINPHKNYYQTAKKYLYDHYKYDVNCIIDESKVFEYVNNQLGEDIVKEMVESNSIVSILFYPDTPIGFYEVYHSTLEKALDLALECLVSNN